MATINDPFDSPVGGQNGLGVGSTVTSPPNTFSPAGSRQMTTVGTFTAFTINSGAFPNLLRFVSVGALPSGVAQLNYVYTVAQDVTTLVNIGFNNVSFGALAAGTTVAFRANLGDIDSISNQITGTYFPAYDPMNPAGPYNILFPISTFNNNADKTAITRIFLAIVTLGTANASGTIESFGVDVACLAKDTEILMADSSIKLIQDLKRGDDVAGNTDATISHKIARILRTPFPIKASIDTAKILKDTFGPYCKKYAFMSKAHKFIFFRTLFSA